MAPADNPSVVIAAVARPSSGQTAPVATPVFQRLLAYTLAHRKIRPSGIPPSLVPLTWE